MPKLNVDSTALPHSFDEHQDPEPNRETIRDSRTAERLVWIHLAVNFALPIYALLYVFYQGDKYGLSEQAQGMALNFILVIVLNGFFQLVARDFMHQTPRQIALGLAVPLIYMGLAALIWKASPGWYLFELGVLHGFSLMVAYFIVVYVRPLLSLAIFRMTRADLRWYLFASGLQLLLLVPALIAAVGFGELIYLVYTSEAEMATGKTVATTAASADLDRAFLLDQPSIRFVWFGLTLLQVACHEYAWLRRAAPNA